MNLVSFVGNNEVKKRLSDYFINGRLPHFIILQGEEGTGKRTLAKLIASAAVCRSDAFSAPCFKCSACVRAKAGSHPDIKTIVGTGVSGQISVDSIKNIIEDAYLKPEESDNSIYLIFAGNIMSEASQNKLLKIIEEPPKGVMFILCIKSSESLLPTVRSRASIFTLKAPEKAEVFEYLTKEYPEKTSDEINDSIDIFRGNIGRIKSFLDEETSENGKTSVINAADDICRMLLKSDEHSLLLTFSQFIKDKQRLGLLIASLSEIFRDACAYKSGSEVFISFNKEAAMDIGRKLTRAQLLRLPVICREYAEYLGKNANTAILITAFCAELRKAVDK